MRGSPLTLLLFVAAPMLSGCVAAAAPVLAGGLIARKTADRHGRAAPAPVTAATATPAILPMPSEVARMVPGQPYAGALPGRPAEPATVATTTSAPAGTGAAATGWPELVRFVAVNKNAPRHSALLVRGGTLTDPHWVACADKPRAVLVPVSLVLSGEGAARRVAEHDLGWIVALPTMGTTVVLVAASPADAAAARMAFKQAGLADPVAGDTLVMATSDAALPAARAAIGARYCVVAVAGTRATDFPNALLPDSTPPALADQWRAGWFLFGPPAR